MLTAKCSWLYGQLLSARWSTAFGQYHADYFNPVFSHIRFLMSSYITEHLSFGFRSFFMSVNSVKNVKDEKEDF